VKKTIMLNLLIVATTFSCNTRAMFSKKVNKKDLILHGQKTIKTPDGDLTCLVAKLGTTEFTCLQATTFKRLSESASDKAARAIKNIATPIIKAKRQVQVMSNTMEAGLRKVQEHCDTIEANQINILSLKKTIADQTNRLTKLELQFAELLAQKEPTSESIPSNNLIHKNHFSNNIQLKLNNPNEFQKIITEFRTFKTTITDKFSGLEQTFTGLKDQVAELNGNLQDNLLGGYDWEVLHEYTPKSNEKLAQTSKEIELV